MPKGHSGIYNIKSKEGFRKELRHNLTPAEAVLWKNLKGRQLDGKKFRRQHGIGPFIVDFYCPECRLAIELDGQGHYTDRGRERDLAKQDFLRDQGIRVIRFQNRVLFEDIQNVLLLIREAIHS